MHFEIRLWARTQIAASIEIEPEGAFQAVPNRALWTARVRRVDWREQGVEWVRVANQILTEGDHIIDFASDPREAANVTPLGNLWLPSSAPNRIAARPHGGGVDHHLNAGQADPPAAAGLPVVLAGMLVTAYVRLRRPRAPQRQCASSLISTLAAWRRRQPAQHPCTRGCHPPLRGQSQRRSKTIRLDQVPPSAARTSVGNPGISCSLCH